MTPVPIVLAAGASSRLGEPKALARIGERTALEHLLVARALKIRVPEVGIMWNHVDGSKVNPIVDGLKMLGRIISMRGSVSKRAGNPDLAHEPPLVLLAAPSQVEVHTVTTSAEHAAAKAAEEAVAETTANESTEFSRSV